jgi:hypothetical protein
MAEHGESQVSGQREEQTNQYIRFVEVSLREHKASLDSLLSLVARTTQHSCTF